MGNTVVTEVDPQAPRKRAESYNQIEEDVRKANVL